MRVSLGAVAIAVSLLGVGAASAEQPNFAGKTIRFVINFPTGGSIDPFFRAFIPYISRNLPGAPTIVVEHRPGAGGRTGAAYLFNVAKPDGLTIGGMAGVASDAVLGLDAKFDALKFTWLGAIPQTQVWMTRDDLNITSPADLRTIDRTLVFGALGRSTTNYIASALAMSMLGLSFKDVHGYTVQGATIHALRQKEVDLADVGIALFLPNRQTWLKEGLLPLVQRGDLQPDGSFRRSPLIPDLPTVAEALQEINPKAVGTEEFAAYRMIVASYALQFGVLAPPGMDSKLASVMSKAVTRAFEDPQAREGLRRQMNLEYNFVDSDQVRVIVDRLNEDARANPGARAILRRMASQK